MRGARRSALTVRAAWRESLGALRLCDDPRSRARLVGDVMLYRVLRLYRLPRVNALRRIRLRTGEVVAYRLNRGDIQSIREVLLDEVYRLPFPLEPKVIVDLGANIGLTSLYLKNRYEPAVVIAVEADATNAELTRRNCEPLGVTVIEAAIGPHDGIARFFASNESNLGAVSGPDGEGTEVPMISMPTLLDDLGITTIDLLKMDIEGGEQVLLDGPTEWLSRVRAIIAEFHPGVVDYEGLVRRLVEHGFRYFPAGSAWPGSMDAFVREQQSVP